MNLSFTKLISYASRRNSNIDKALADLEDFSNLTNHDTWNSIDFYTMVANTNAYNYLKESLKFTKVAKDILDKSSLYQLVNLFRDPTNEISKIPNPTADQKKRVEKAIMNGEEFINRIGKQNIAAIGIDLIGFTAINMKHGPEVGDKIIEVISSLIEKADLKQHKTEVVGDTFIVYLILENQTDLESYAAQIHGIINSHNWREIQENLFVNAYTTFGLIGQKETIHDFSKRIFDSILSQKEKGYVFKKIEEKISRGDWDIEQMVSHR